MSQAMERSDAKKLENKIWIAVLIYGGFVFTCYIFPPLSSPLRFAYKAAGFTGTAIKETAKLPEKITDSIAPDYYTKKIVSGDKIGPYTVGKRGYFPCIKPDKSDCTIHPITGKLSAHRGIDLGAPGGTQQYVPGLKGPVEVECLSEPNGAGTYAIITPTEPKNTRFVSMHLSKCAGGKYKPGQVFGLTGSTGMSTGPHWHWEQKTLQNGQWVRVHPEFAWLWQSVTGNLPKPPITSSKP